MKHILFIGSHPPKSLIERSKGRINSFYRDSFVVINGLRSQKEVRLDVITSPDISSFPHNNLYYRGYYDTDEDTYVVSSLNIPIIKQFWTIASMLYAAIKSVRSQDQEMIVIIPYMVFRHVVVAKILRIIMNRKVKVCIIIPDIFFPKERIIRKLNSFTERIARGFDFFILYTASMADYLGLSKSKYIVIEGFHEVSKLPTIQLSDKFIVTYSGSLNASYGIIRLLESMKYISNNDIELHLYGAGDAVEKINDYLLKDSRIRYFGLVSKEQAMDSLAKSSVLVNPRSGTDGDYVKFSFPSKNIDYLASGIPCILCKLPGMPEEYYGYFVDAKDGSPASLAKAILIVYSMTESERFSLAEKAHAFISQRMDMHVQTERILKLLSYNTDFSTRS